MKPNQLIHTAILAGLLALGAPQAAVAGLKITTVLLPGDPPPPDAIAGGGNLQAIFEEAAKKWEKVFSKGGSKWEITIQYGWTNTVQSGYAYGFERTLAQGGTPVRITRSVCFFNNTAPPPNFYPWYADPSPKNNSEYRVYSSTSQELEDQDFNPLGMINVGRVFSEATGPAVGRVDLLTVAMHEIGHALGLDSDYLGYRAQVNGSFMDITSPLPFAGYHVALSLATADHIVAFGQTPLMVSEPEPGWRQLISGGDALVLAQLSSFAWPELGEPPGVPKTGN